jgi:5-formyltetrahydrofolate cyclo-ligase
VEKKCGFFMSEKVFLRKKFRKDRDSLSTREIVAKSRVIQEKVINSEEFRSAKMVFVYKNYSSEVHTGKIIETALKQKKVVCVPFAEQNEMKCTLISGQTVFERGEYGIPVPVERKFVAPEKIDLVVVPGIAFDEKGNRIGSGKGYYDRFLKKTKPNCYIIGLCFSEQIVKKIPFEEFDVKMSCVISEKENLSEANPFFCQQNS